MLKNFINYLWSLSLIGLLCSNLFFGCSPLDPSEPGNLVRPTVEHDQTIPSLSFNNSKFHVETFGNPVDTPIIFLHGGPAADFKILLNFLKPLGGRKLDDEYYCIFWDQRSTGLSKRHDASVLSQEQYLKDLEKLIEILIGDRKFYIIGHSWGGLFAAMYMNAHPDNILGAVLLEPSSFSSDIRNATKNYSINYTSEWLNDFIWGRKCISMDDHETADYYLSVMFNMAEDELQPKFHEHNEPPKGWRCSAIVLLEMDFKQNQEGTYDHTSNLHLVEPEILCIVGGLTEMIGYEFQQKQMAYFKNSSIEVIPNAGHVDICYLMVEQSLTLIFNYLDNQRKVSK